MIGSFVDRAQRNVLEVLGFNGEHHEFTFGRGSLVAGRSVNSIGV